MASLLKNQILKHLSKFTKNLSSDKINLSTFKGEGELSNLELNEDILTNLLELPSWLRITKAVCNRVAVKIQWTKLKSQPICLYLDEVIVETETCQELRPPASQNQQAFGGKYGFVDRVMDGIFVHVNSVVVKLTSHKFQASLQLSRVQVQSMTPKWQKPSDLRSTRIRDATRGEILLFKEIEWQTTRIEATAVDSQEDSLTPLRLIANQAKIRIVVKKRLSDSAIISSRLTLLLDDLLWVLTITQLKAAILYANSLKELIERSSKQSKAFAAEKLKKQGYIQDSGQPQHRQHRADRQESSTAKLFKDFDVASTSYHLITSRFDLHLCDDRAPDQEERRHWKVNGGSMQITFYKLSLDMYPYHPAGGERKSWSRYSDNVGSRNPWVQKLFAEFRDEAVSLRQACEGESTLSASSSAPSLLAVHQAAVSTPQTSPRSGKRNLNPASSSQSASTSPVHAGYPPGYKQPQGARTPQGSPSHQGQGSTRLLESCFVVKMEDVTVYMVNTPGQKRKTGQQKLLASDKRQLHLPPEMSVFHLEYTDYFFPDGLHYPVPHANLYVLINPVRITMDYQTVLWSNIFMNTLSKSLDMDFGETEQPSEHVDIKVELVMPRLILPAEESVEGQPDRPEAVQLQISKMVISNCRMEDTLTRAGLQSVLTTYDGAKLLSETEFPCDDLCQEAQTIPEILRDHAVDKDNAFLHPDVKAILSNSKSKAQSSSNPSKNGSNQQQNQLSPPPSSSNPPSVASTHKLDCDSLKRLSSADIWAFSAEQVWLEFLGVQNCKNRPVPFVEAIPIAIWISVSEYQKTIKTIKKPLNSNSSNLHYNANHPNSSAKGQSSSQGPHHNHHQQVRIDIQRAVDRSSSPSSNTHRQQQPSSSSPSVSKSSTSHQSNMPVLGSSPPVCDNTNIGRGSSTTRSGTNGSRDNQSSSSSSSRNPGQRSQSQGRQDCISSTGDRDPSQYHQQQSSYESRDSRDSFYPSQQPLDSTHSPSSSRSSSHHYQQQQQQRYEDSPGSQQQINSSSSSSSKQHKMLTDDDRRPSCLSISPDASSRGDNNNASSSGGGVSSSSRRSRTTSQSQPQYRERVDSPHAAVGAGGDRKRSSRSSSSQEINTSSSSHHHHPHHQQQQQHSDQGRYGSSSDVYAADSDHHPQYQQQQESSTSSSSSRHRRERRLQREDSRSSSSPPISSSGGIGGGRDRDSSLSYSSRGRRDSGGLRDRSSGDVVVDSGSRKTEPRLMRQSSSSSSDRRGETMEGCNRNGDGWRDERSMAEGQASLEFGRGDEDRSGVGGRPQGGRRRSKEDIAYYGNRREKERDGEKRTHRGGDKSSGYEPNPRDVASMNFRNNRQNSSSSSERGWTGHQPSASRDRRMTRSSSRERRDLTYEMERQELERGRDRGGGGGGSRSGNSGERDRNEDRVGGGAGYDHAEEGDGKRWSYDDVRDQQRGGRSRARDADCDFDNDVTVKGGRGTAGSGRRVRDLQAGGGGSRSRESSLTRNRERDGKGGRSGSGRYDGTSGNGSSTRLDRVGFGVHHQDRHPHQSATDPRSRSSDRSEGIQDSRVRSSSSRAATEFQGAEEGGRYSSSTSSARQKRYEVEDDEEEVGEEEEEEEEDDIDQSFRNHQELVQHDRNRNAIHHRNDADNNNYSSQYHDSMGRPVPVPPPPSSQSQEDGAWTHHSARPTPEGCKAQDEYHLSANNSIEKTEPVNRLCVLVHVDRKVRVQVTHYQYVFLLRLSESFSTFQAELSTDLVSRNSSSNTSDPSSNCHQSSSSSSSSNRHHQRSDNHRIPKDSQYSSTSSSYIPSSSIPPPPPSPETEIFIPLVLKEIELAVVCPYQMHQRTFSDDLSIMSPFLGGLAGGQDAVFGDEADNTTCFPGLVDNRQGRRARDDSTLQRLQQSISFKSNSSGQLENISHLTPQSAFDSRGGGLSSSVGSNSAFPTTMGGPGQSSSRNTAASAISGGGQSSLPFQSEWSSSIRKESSDTISQSAHSVGRDSGIGVERKSHQSSSSRGKSGGGGSKGGVDNVKKSFTSAFSSFTDKIKNKMEGLDDMGGHGGDDLDTMSIRTDTSDDDFELMSLEDMEEAPAFAHQQPPPHEVPSAEDIYSDFVDQGDSVSVYAESSTTKGKEMVYIVLFKLDNTEVLANMDNAGTSTCVQLSKLASLQLGNISYDDFYSRFSTERGYIQEELSKIPSKKSSPLPPGAAPSTRSPIRLKFTAPAFDPTLNLPVDPGFMAVQVEDYCLQFKMSGLTCLSDFMEDEKLPETVPMSITVHNLLLVLEEDRPPANITSPGSVPVNLCIKHICIDRTKDGMFHVSGPMAGYSPMPNGGDVNTAFKFPASPAGGSGIFSPASPASTAATAHKPQLVNHATSPLTSPDGTLALLMASQNENVLLKRQLEEVRRANRLYEHQILQWRDMQDSSSIASGGGTGIGSSSSKPIFAKRQSFTSDMLSGSPSSSSGISDSRGGVGGAGLMGNHVLQQPPHSMTDVGDAYKEDMERENLRLQHQIVRLEDDLLTVSKEKESLLQTLKLLQDELLMSERHKRTKNKM